MAKRQIGPRRRLVDSAVSRRRGYTERVDRPTSHLGAPPTADDGMTPRERESRTPPPRSPGFAQYIATYESEMRVIAGLSAGQRDVEVVGNTFGQFTRAGRPVIGLVIGPGPNAVYESAHCQQDIEFFRRAVHEIESAYGLQWLGDWHSHHHLGIDHPSPGDVRQVQSVTTKNGLTQWCDIITVLLGDPSPAPCRAHSREADSAFAFRLRVGVNAFVYPDPQRGQPIRAAIRVLPGISPFRLDALAGARLSGLGISDQAAWFPFEQIAYESLRRTVDTSDPAEEISPLIVEHVSQLPAAVQQHVEFRVQHDTVAISFPLTNGRMAHVTYDKRPPHPVLAVRVVDAEGSTNDLTTTVLCDGPSTELDRIHERCVSTDVVEGMSCRGAVVATHHDARLVRMTGRDGSSVPANIQRR